MAYLMLLAFHNDQLVHRIFSCVSRREKYNENYTRAFAWIIEIVPLSVGNPMICPKKKILKSLRKSVCWVVVNVLFSKNLSKCESKLRLSQNLPLK